MKKMKGFSMAMVVVFLMTTLCGPTGGNCSSAYASEAGATVDSGRQADKLLGLYFKRIDSFYAKGKYDEAKNELSKVYMIDPSNIRAKDYETKIETAQHKKIQMKEEDLAKREAILGAEKVLKERQEINTAFGKLLERRQNDKDAIIKSYYDTGEENQVEFDRLQKLGIEKYKETVMREAREAEKHGRSKLAVAKYQDILAIDPNDIKARAAMQAAEEKIEKKKNKFMLDVENIDDAELLRTVTEQALGAEDYKSASQGGGIAPSIKEPKPPIKRALEDQLTVPVTADFRDVSLVSVLNFLSDYTGINIIASQMVLNEDRKVSVRFKNLPLESALKYILKGQGLAYRIEDDVIWIATEDEMENEELETRVFYLQKGSGVFTQFASASIGVWGSGAHETSVSGTKTIKDVIEEAISFPPGAKIIFDERLSVLIVTNTPTNLQKVEQLLHIIDEPPQQILIESRFIEVQLDDSKNLGIDMDLKTDAYLSEKLGASKKEYGLLSSSGWDFTGVAPSINSDTGGFNLAFAGLLTHPEYQVYLNALQRSEKTKTLSAPKVTTVNNQTATIKVTTEEVFPTRFEVSLIQQDLNGDGDLDDAGETEFANVPQEFVSRDIGIILQVTPSVGMDHKTITLSIIPEVSAVAATPAKFTTTSYTNGVETQQGTGTPDLPRFTTSTLSTTIVLESGETAMLGGLITETRGQTHEKLPLLGDIPVIGKLFQSNQDEITRRNLIIFITGSVLN